MEGSLYKWCGPFSRWQTRYCVIHNGQLDFYTSKELMQSHEAVLESHHIASCEINLHKKSLTEWSIQSAGKDLVYLKAESAESRRFWIKLLGSAKACVANTAVLSSRQNSISSTTSVITTASEGDIANLRPKSDKFFNQESSTAPCSPVSVPKPKRRTQHLEKISLPIKSHSGYLTSEVDSTQSLETSNFESQSLEQNLNTFCDVCKDLTVEIGHLQKSVSAHETYISSNLQHDAGNVFQLFAQFSELLTTITEKSGQNSDLQDSDDIESDTNGEDHESVHTADSGYVGSGTPPIQQKTICVPTFFSTVEVSFSDVFNEANNNAKDDLISSVQSETYIAACIHYTKFFDLFAGTLLAPLKSDILSNSEKVRKGFQKNPERYTHMQTIIDDEIAKKEHLHPDSTTQAVLWMMRGLRTISMFITIGSTPGHPAFRNTNAALDTAYREHLRRYHNFVVQRMFTVGLKLVPSYDHFKKQVVMDSSLDVNSDAIDAEIRRQALSYCKSMTDVVSSIEKIYIHHKIDL